MSIETLSFVEFASRYCSRQRASILGLKETLRTQASIYDPDGWMLLVCEMLDSSLLGSMTILVYGPNNTHKEVMTRPVSPRGLASDMSVVNAVLLNTSTTFDLTQEDLSKIVSLSIIQAQVDLNHALNSKSKRRKTTVDELAKANKFEAACNEAKRVVNSKLSLEEKEATIKELLAMAATSA